MNRFFRNPFQFLGRALYKKFVGPLVYSTQDGYNAPKYWADRFTRYGESIKGPGDEGITDEENLKMYADAKRVFVDACVEANVDFKNGRFLEVGVGTAFYSGTLRELGVKDYTGIDITDVLFDMHRARLPEYRFFKKDITAENVGGRFDVVVMIDVIQHIVNREKFSAAMRNIRGCLGEGGLLIIGPVWEKNKQHLFYVRFWTAGDVLSGLEAPSSLRAIPFRTGELLTIRVTN